jgi:hypothetical protein
MKKSLVIIASMLLAIAGLVSCSRSRSDAAITADVQAKVHQDAALSATPITVQSSSGVVVLSGNVATDTARISAENDARQVKGVKNVINNLQVAVAAAPQPAPVVSEAQIPQSRPQTARAPTRPRTPRATVPAPAPAAPVARVEPVPPPVQAVAPPPAQPVPALVTIPAGTRLTVRLIDPVDTAKNKEGDSFRATLDSPIVIQNKTVIPKNAEATARLVSAKSAGRFKGSSSVVLVLSTISVGVRSYDLQTGEFTQQGASRGKRTAEVVGGGAAVGALIGAIAGGGKGAAVGAAAGAGAGTGVQALTKGQQIKLPAETRLEFELQAPLTVMPAAEPAQRTTVE